MLSEYQRAFTCDTDTDSAGLEGKSLLRDSECLFKKCCKKYKKAGKKRCKSCPKR